MSEPKTAEVKVADLAEFMRAGSGKVALSREIIVEIERRAKSQKVRADGLTGEARASLYSCPAATQSLLKDEGLDLFAWLCDESSDAIAAQAGAAFLGDWSICSASLMRDPYSARPYVLFYVEAEAKAAPASPPAKTGEGLLDAINLASGRGNGEPVPVTIFCPLCDVPHVDEGEWARERRHKTHQCQRCGHEWRPFPFATVGVAHPAQPVSPSEGEAVGYEGGRPAGWSYAYDDGMGARRFTVLNDPAPLPAKKTPTKHHGSPISDVREFFYTRPASDQSDTERMREAQIAWRGGEPPKDGTVFYGHHWTPHRWLPYSPKSEQAKRGVKGRWQAMNEFGGWDNASAPNEWATEEAVSARAAALAEKAAGK